MTKKIIPEPAPVVNEPRQEWQIDAQRAVGNRLMADVVADFRRPLSNSASMIPEKQRAAGTERPPSGGGTVEVRPPPGVNYIDRMCDAADRQEQIARARIELENQWIESHFTKGPRIERDYNPFSGPQMDK